MVRYLIVIEETSSGFSSYSPDVPGCVSTGQTRADVELRMREAITAHLDELREGGGPPPRPISTAAYIEVAA